MTKSAAVHHTVAPYEFLMAIRHAPDRNWKVVFNDFEQIVFLYNGVGSDKLACPVTYECPYHDMDPGKVAQFVDQVSQTILWKIGGAQAMAEPRDVQPIKTPVSTTRPDGMGLTSAEHKALRLTVEIAELFATEIVGLGQSSKQDHCEAAAKIHDLQRMIMAQAAARAHPDLYRLLGKGGDWLSAK